MAAQQEFEQSWPELMEPAAAGDRQIRLNRKPDSKFRHWLMDILAVDLSTRAPDGFGWIAHLVKPLRHSLYAIQNGAGQQLQRMAPLDSERLWNREAGRPYTRTELGLCDCGAPVTSGKLRASIGEFDAMSQFVDAKLAKLEADFSRAWMWPNLKDRRG